MLITIITFCKVVIILLIAHTFSVHGNVFIGLVEIMSENKHKTSEKLQPLLYSHVDCFLCWISLKHIQLVAVFFILFCFLEASSMIASVFFCQRIFLAVTGCLLRLKEYNPWGKWAQAKYYWVYEKQGTDNNHVISNMVLCRGSAGWPHTVLPL